MANKDNIIDTEPQKEIEPEIEEQKISWDEMNIKDDLLRGIYSYGYEKPSSIQQKSIPIMFSGRDIIAQAQSGMGKTGSFSIGTLQNIDVTKNNVQALFLAPTHELAKQTNNVVKSIGSMMNGLKTKILIGGTSIQDDAEDIKNNTPHIIIGCAGRVHDMFRRRYLSGAHIKVFVLDEADEMLSDGFKEQIYNIFQCLNSNVQTALFSATLPDDILELTEKFMRDPARITMKAETLNLECIKQYYIAIQNDNMKFETLKDLFSCISVSQCIIYCNSVNRVTELYRAMIDDGFSVSYIHSSMNSVERGIEFTKFRNGGYRVLISSNVTARGIDIQQVGIVINFDIPKCQHTYLHRIGRSGRWGRKGMAINFVTRRDIHSIKKIESFYSISMEELPNNFTEQIA